MSTLSDLIESYIKQRLQLSNDQDVALSRAKLAKLFDCVPSQINYVLTTRFTPDRGYLIESRRGGGGYIRIVQLAGEQYDNIAARLFSEIGPAITEKESEQYLASFQELGVLSDKQLRIIRGILQQETATISQGRNTMRASLLRGLVFLTMNIDE